MTGNTEKRPDSSYAQYGATVDILIEKLQDAGASNVLDLQGRLNPSAVEKEDCKSFGRHFVQSLS